MTPLRQRAAYYPITLMSRCYVDQQIGPTLSSCNRRRSSELRQSWATVVELSWNNSRTRVGVAELSAGRVAWARDAEAMSRLGNDSDFSMTFSDFQSRIAGSPKSIPFIHRLPGLSSVMFGDVRRCSAILSELQFTIVTVGSFSIAKRPRDRISSSGRVPSFGRESILDHRSCCASLRYLLDSSVETSPGVVPTSPFRSTSSNSKDRSKVNRIALLAYS